MLQIDEMLIDYLFSQQNNSMFISDFFAIPCFHEISQYHLVQPFIST